MATSSEIVILSAAGVFILSATEVVTLSVTGVVILSVAKDLESQRAGPDASLAFSMTNEGLSLRK